MFELIEAKANEAVEVLAAQRTIERYSDVKESEKHSNEPVVNYVNDNNERKEYLDRLVVYP